MVCGFEINNCYFAIATTTTKTSVLSGSSGSSTSNGTCPQYR